MSEPLKLISPSNNGPQAGRPHRLPGCGFCTEVASHVGFIDQKTGNPPDIQTADEGYALIDKIQQLKRWLHAVEYTAIAETARKTFLQQEPRRTQESVTAEFLGTNKARWTARTLYATLSSRLGTDYSVTRRMVRDSLYFTDELTTTLAQLRAAEISVTHAQEIAFQHNQMLQAAEAKAHEPQHAPEQEEPQTELPLEKQPDKQPTPAPSQPEPSHPSAETAEAAERKSKELEAELLDAAKHLGGRRFKNHARSLRERKAPESRISRARAAVLKRHLHISAAGDGMGRISGLLPLDRLAMLDTHLEARSRSVLGRAAARKGRSHKQVKADEFLALLSTGFGQATAPSEEPSEAPTPVVPANQNGQAVLDGLEDFAEDVSPQAADRALVPQPATGQRAKIVVTIPVELLIASGGYATPDLLKDTDQLHPVFQELAHTNRKRIEEGQAPLQGGLPYEVPSPQAHGYGPISPQAAIEMARQAQQWITLITNPATGVPLGLGKKNYRPSQQLKTLLELRDQYCRVPGCHHPAAACEIDHVTGWAQNGSTDLANLALLCHEHHMLKSSGVWKISSARDGKSGDLEIRLPDGRVLHSPCPEFEAGRRWDTS